MSLGLVGRKVGMTRVFTQDGVSIPVTVIEVEPNRVTQVKTADTDGYTAVQISFGAIDPRKVAKPNAGHFAKAGVTPRAEVAELRVSNTDSYSVGQELKADVFAAGDFVDATGTSKGKGSAGVMKRHGFSGIGAAHGVAKKHRMPGSVGNRTTPGRVFKGKRMMGRMGVETVTAQNLLIHSVDADKNVILVRGAIAGPIGATVFLRTAAKKVASETLNSKAGA